MHALEPHSAPGEDGPSVHEIRSLEEFLPLEDEWRGLFERAPAPNLFQAWEWLAPRLACYWKSQDLSILLVRRKGRLVGAAPLVLDRKGAEWCPATLVVVGGEGLLCDEPSAAVMDAVLGHLRRSRRWWRLGLTSSPGPSDIAARMPDLAGRHGLDTLVRSAPPSAIVRFGGSWEEYLASRSNHVRREWKRKEKKLRAAGSVEVRTITEPSECEAALDDVMAIESASWKEEGRSSITARARDGEFYRELARRCAERGWLRLHVLFLGGRPVAHFYGVLLANRLYGLKTTYDLSCSHLSPGVVVVQHALRAACAEGVSTVDLLGHEGRWKGEVANEEQPILRVCAFPRSHLGCEACSLVRTRVQPFAQRRAPALLAAARGARTWLRLRESRG